MTMEITWLTISGLCGVALSVYSYFVEVQKHNNPKYRAACDFGEYASCSRVLTSPYSRGFGLVRCLLGENHVLNAPNCIVGIVFYCLQLLIEQVPGTMARHLQFDLSVMACAGSLYLAYILAFVLHDLCIVCISTYVINAYLLYESYGRLAGGDL